VRGDLAMSQAVTPAARDASGTSAGGNR